MWDLIVSVPDRCLSFNSDKNYRKPKKMIKKTYYC